MSERLWLLAAAFCAALLLPAGPRWCPAAERPSAEQKIEEELGRPTQLEFVETPLQDVFDFLKRHHKIEIQIDRKALDDVGLDPSNLPISKRLKGLSLRSTLGLMLRDLDLTYLVDDEVLLITTPEEEQTRLTTKLYPVGDLIASGSRTEQKRQLDELADLLGSSPDDSTWEWGCVGTTFFQGVPTLVVRQSYRMHREIAALLEEQRGVIRAARQAAVPRCPVVVLDMTPAVERIEKALKQPTEFSFVETPLADVVDYLKKKHQIEIQIDRKSLDDVGLDPATIPITKNCKGISLRSALRLLLRRLDLTYVIQHEVLLITTPEEAETRLRTKLYAVGDLRGPSGFSVKPSGVPVGMGMSGMGMWNVSEKPDDEAETKSPSQSETDPSVCGLNVIRPVDTSSPEDTLIDLITTVVEPTSWDEVGGVGSIVGASFRGVDVLVVSNSDDAHEDIARLLERLREFIRCNQSPAAPAAKPAVPKPPADEPPKTPPPAPTPAVRDPGGSN